MTERRTKRAETGNIARKAPRRTQRVLNRMYRTATRLRKFDLEYLSRPGVNLLAGIDEAGRGALAGPVVAAVVVVDKNSRFPKINDSKLLHPGEREALYPRIWREAPGAAVGWASALEIDRINILQASRLAARRAFSALTIRPDFVLTDFLKFPEFEQPVVPLVDGDALSQAIAAASVLAKVTRDRLMAALDLDFPGYGFPENKGYSTPSHWQGIEEHGPSTIHRFTFEGVQWFDSAHRRSNTLIALLEEMPQANWQEKDLEEVWLSRGYFLPEAEYEILVREFQAFSQAAASSKP